MHYPVFHRFIDDMGDVCEWLVDVGATPHGESIALHDRPITHTALNVLLALVRVPSMAAKIADAQRGFAKILLRCRMTEGPAARVPLGTTPSQAKVAPQAWAMVLSVQAKVVQLLAVVHAHARRAPDGAIAPERKGPPAATGAAHYVHTDLLVAMGVLLQDTLDALEYPPACADPHHPPCQRPHDTAVVHHLKVRAQGVGAGHGMCAGVCWMHPGHRTSP